MARLGVTIARQNKKGAPKDAGFRDISPVKRNPQNPYTNPAKPSKTLRGTLAQTKKLGKN